LISNNFQGLEGQILPDMTDQYIATVSERYIELYENITGKTFEKANTTNITQRIEKNVLQWLSQ
jgi:phosphoribosylaminoimidazole-succinocarboxamide synthase